jgi:hypothetical protein
MTPSFRASGYFLFWLMINIKIKELAEEQHEEKEEIKMKKRQVKIMRMSQHQTLRE